MPNTDSKFIIILGCGRLGGELSNKLMQGGHSIVVIDNDENTFSSLSLEFGGFKIEGDVIELAVLKQAKIDKSDIVIASTGNDNVNFMSALIAKKIFNVPKVIARMANPRLEPLFAKHGITTICTTELASRYIINDAL